MRWAISLEEAQEDCVSLSDCTNGCLLFQKTASIHFADYQVMSRHVLLPLHAGWFKTAVANLPYTSYRTLGHQLRKKTFMCEYKINPPNQILPIWRLQLLLRTWSQFAVVLVKLISEQECLNLPLLQLNIVFLCLSSEGLILLPWETAQF